MKTLIYSAFMILAVCSIQACSTTRTARSGSDSTSTGPGTTGTSGGSGNQFSGSTNGTTSGSATGGSATTVSSTSSQTSNTTGNSTGSQTSTTTNDQTNSVSGSGTTSNTNNNQSSSSSNGSTSGIGNNNGGMSNTGSLNPEMFVTQAALSGMKEVETGKIAQQKAQNSKLKAFGKMMSRDHSKANSELMAFAKSKNITLPSNGSLNQSTSNSTSGNTGNTGSTTGTTGNTGATGTTGTAGSTNQMHGPVVGSDSLQMLSSADIQMGVQQLNQLSGEAFDTAYTAMMIKDHKNAVLLFEQASNSNDPAVKAFASKQLPILKSHLTQILTIGGAGAKSGGDNASGTGANHR